MTQGTQVFKPGRASLLSLCIATFFYNAQIYLVGTYITIDAYAIGAPFAVATSLMAITSLVPIFTALFLGAYSDRTGRRKSLIAIGAAVGLAANIGMGLAVATGSWSLLLVFRILVGITNAILSIFMILFVFHFAAEKRGKALGLYASSSLGASAVMMLLSAGLVSLWGTISLYYASAIFSVVAMIFLLGIKTPEFKKDTRVSGKELKATFKNPMILYLGISFLVMNASMGVMGGLNAPFAMTMGLPLMSVGLIAFVGVMGGVLAATLGGHLYDKMGAPKLLIVSCAGMAVGLFVYTIVIQQYAFAMLSLAMLLITIFNFWGGTIYRSASSKLVRPEMAQTAMGVIVSISSIGTAFGGTLAGLVVTAAGGPDGGGYYWGWIYGVVLALVCLLMAIPLFKWMKGTSKAYEKIPQQTPAK